MNRRLLLMTAKKEKFLLRDDFTDTLAAGSVNGTLAKPGGIGTVAQNTRNVTDVENKITVAAGALTFSGGKAAAGYGDPLVSYGSETRVAGKVLIVSFTPTATTKYQFVGWCTTATPSTDATLLGLYCKPSGVVGLFYVDANNFALSTYTAVAQKQAIVLGSIGAYFLFKSGANWLFGWRSITTNTTPMYPIALSYDATFTVENLRIPTALWLPRPLCYDTFTRANAAIGTSETAGPDSQDTTARTWTGTTYTIATNVAVNTPTLGSELATGALVVGTWYSITATQANYFYTGSAIGDTFRATATTALDANNKVKAITLATLFASQTDVATADVVVSAALVATTRMQTGIIVNLDSATSPANFIIAYIDQNVGAGTTRILVDECVAGTYTNKVTVTNATYGAAARLVVIRDGASCRVIYNNRAVGTVQTMTANTNTLHGLFSTNVANTFDNFLVMPRGTGGEYSSLDRFTKGD